MTSDWKNDHANEANAFSEHELIEDVRRYEAAPAVAANREEHRMTNEYEAITFTLNVEAKAITVDQFPEWTAISDGLIEGYFRECVEDPDGFRLKALQIREGEVEFDVANGHAIYSMVAYDPYTGAWRLQRKQVIRPVEAPR